MRLICPNCNAQYEIDGSVIPEAGRDVQCSACGHAWFQMPESVAEPDGDADAASDEADPSPQPAAQQAASASPSGAAQRRQIDPSILEVLREEAEFEARARRNESTPIETQADLGLSIPRPARPQVTAQRAASARPASARDDTPEPKEPAEVPSTEVRPSRRDRLPDIDTVGPSLDQPPVAGNLSGIQEDPAAAPPRRRSGFRTGFLTAMTAFALVALVYVFSGRIVALVPASEALMTGFVGAVEQGRTWLNDAVRGLVGLLSPEAGRAQS